jgi:hypothetical protein
MPFFTDKTTVRRAVEKRVGLIWVPLITLAAWGIQSPQDQICIYYCDKCACHDTIQFQSVFPANFQKIATNRNGESVKLAQSVN